MEIDKVIRAAIQESVAASGQSSELAKKIVAWVETLSSGSEDLGGGDAATRHLEVLYASVNELETTPRRLS